jgi:uncharacterized membrane protein (UPF0127 family)
MMILAGNSGAPPGKNAGNDPKTTLIDIDSGSVIATDVFIANSFWHRLRGLQFKREVPPGHAFILPGCNSVHTCFMRFDIDVIFVDKNWRVLMVFKGVTPFRFIKPQRGAYAAIEIKAGQADVCAGHRLQLTTKNIRDTSPYMV